MNFRPFLPISLIAMLATSCLPVTAGDGPDPQMQEVLYKLKELGGKPIETLDAVEARKQPTPADAVSALLKSKGKEAVPEKVAEVANKTYPGATGGELPMRIYTPEGTGPFPVIVYYHGGGWVIADLDTYDATPRALANATKAVVVSVHYSQAPERKFPAAHNDALAAYEWVQKHPETLNGLPRNVAVAGESAGGNMAASVCLMAKEKGLPMPVHQLLVYPVTDATSMDTQSYKTHADAVPLNKPMMQWFAKQALAEPGDAKNPKLSVALAGSALEGMPPATIINAEIDPLCSDGEKLQKALEAQKVKVTRKVYPGVTHEFFGMGAAVDTAHTAMEFAASQLRTAFQGVALETKATAATDAP